MVIAIVLGPMAESNMRRALTIPEGSYLTFVTRPICAFFIALSLFTFLTPFAKQYMAKRKQNK
jgi:putative tricarboxylic transport membrane protein